MKTYGLIGHPLSHSFSKNYFDKKFIDEGIRDSEFQLYPIENISLFPQLLYDNPDLAGLCVTIPYKLSVLKFLDKLGPNATAIGAVNCIQFKNGELIGYNTDAVGFLRSIQPMLKPHHKKALVLGTGGSSKAVVHVLQNLGLEVLSVSRHEVMENITYTELNEEYLTNYKVIVNCTPVGMYPNLEGYPAIPYEFINEEHILYDLVYNPERTIFLELGKDKGAATKNGYEMLVLQAEENWRIWNS